MAFVILGGRGGSPHAFPSPPNHRQMVFFPALGSPYFLFFSFSSLFLLSLASSQVETEWRQGGRNPGKENEPSPLPQGSPRAQGLSSGGRERSLSVYPLHPGPWLSSQGNWTQGCQTTIRALGWGSGLIVQLLERLSPESLRTGKTGPRSQTHRRLTCGRKSAQ